LKPSKTTAAIAGLIAALCAQRPTLADDIQATCDTVVPGQATLHVKVSGMRSGKGNVTITIYPDDAAHFLDGKFKLARQKVPVTLPVTTACFALPMPGTYAVALFHDENDDGHLNTGALGIPTEGAGFSNNPTLYFGPPSIEKVRFPLHPDDNGVDVTVKYY
jgi:uncharacterized protein (DUF2141 family)